MEVQLATLSIAEFEAELILKFWSYKHLKVEIQNIIVFEMPLIKGLQFCHCTVFLGYNMHNEQSPLKEPVVQNLGFSSNARLRNITV